MKKTMSRAEGKKGVTIVGYDTDRYAEHFSEASDQCRTVERLELCEARTVDDSGYHLPYVERDSNVG